jgi:hypothetical protein
LSGPFTPLLLLLLLTLLLLLLLQVVPQLHFHVIPVNKLEDDVSVTHPRYTYWANPRCSNCCNSGVGFGLVHSTELQLLWLSLLEHTTTTSST